MCVSLVPPTATLVTNAGGKDARDGCGLYVERLLVMAKECCCRVGVQSPGRSFALAGGEPARRPCPARSTTRPLARRRRARIIAAGSASPSHTHNSLVRLFASAQQQQQHVRAPIAPKHDDSRASREPIAGETVRTNTRFGDRANRAKSVCERACAAGHREQPAVLCARRPLLAARVEEARTTRRTRTSRGAIDSSRPACASAPSESPTSQPASPAHAAG